MKVFGFLLGILLAIVILGILTCMFAGLLMLMWNGIIVAALSIAVPLTFLTAFSGVAILYGIIIMTNIIRSAFQNYMQKVQMQVAMKMVRQLEDEMKGAQAQEGDDDILKHFRMS